MSNSLNPVFGEWYTDSQLGTGTDGKVFSIYRQKHDGTREYSILKILRLGENRNERKALEPQDDFITEEQDDEYSKIIKSIIDNVRTLMSDDCGKHFVRYEDIELRNASDGKGKLILIKLERMRSLSDLLKEISFTLDETLRLGISVCKSLVKCRSFGYIYPNLKPENVLFNAEGICKLGDFGTFSTLEPAKTSIAYKRTQYYMPPEYFRTGNVNCTVDTYSLGLILYMLTNRGRLPFTPAYPENVTVNHLNDATEKRVAGQTFERPVFASDDLWKIIQKACAYKPNERYFTPEQMLCDLKNALANKPFEELRYDDVYSVSVPNSSEDVLIPDIEESDNLTEPEQEIEVVSLKEEIKIPDIGAGLGFYKKKPQTKKKQVKYAKLPEIKKKTKKPAYDLKKMIILAVLTALMFLLFIVSVVLQNSDTEQTLTTVTACIYNNIVVYSACGGAIYGF